MEPPKEFLASSLSFLRFLPFFIGLLLLGIIKGAIFCPLICLIITIGNTAVILGLWLVHSIWTYYCIAITKKLGPVLKLVLCACLPVLLILWPLFGIVGSILAGAGYGFLQPLFATFKAVGEGKTDIFVHCIIDGTWSTVLKSFMVVKNLTNVCFYSYFSVMDDLHLQGPPDGKPYEIRLLYLPGALLAGVLGFMVDLPVITVVALYKSPYMLFKGWHQLFHDLIGREGPFLETICVPFAGLAILLWPLAVIGAVLGSMVSSIFLGAYAAVVVYQESSIYLGLRYIISSLSIFDEYSNDVLGMPEGSCFPRPKYRRGPQSRPISRATSFSRLNSFRNPPSRCISIKNSITELNPLEFLDGLFKECTRHREILVDEGLIIPEDMEESRSSRGDISVISVGLPAYCILQTLLRSAKANSDGILLSNYETEITRENRPKDAFFDWFLNPLLILKDQIKAAKLSEAEENYLCKSVLLSGDPQRLKNSNLVTPPESELKRGELNGFARRLRGITKSISKYPPFRGRFDNLCTLSEELAKANGGSQSTNGSQSVQRPRSGIVRTLSRILSQKSFGS